MSESKACVPAVADGHPLTVAEYFAGIGLVRLGLEEAGWRVVFANDISPRKREMYCAAFGDGHPKFCMMDIHALNSASIPLTTLATCSFPCTDLSLAGNQMGLGGTHSSAFWGFVAVLAAQGNAAPPLVMLENVPGWLHANGGRDFRLVIEALNGLGYACDVFMLDALRFVPQSRLRVFVVGSRVHSRGSVGLGSGARSSALTTPRLKACLRDNADLRWMELDVPEPPPLLTSGLGNIVELFSDDDVRWWSVAEVERHMEMMSDAHRLYVCGLANESSCVYRAVYRRTRQGKQRAEVRADDLSGCLRTASGGSARQMLLRCAQGRIRMRHMVSREYARLQGVPDCYPIQIGEIDALTGFGDAVCVPLISWIARHVLGQMVS